MTAFFARLGKTKLREIEIMSSRKKKNRCFQEQNPHQDGGTESGFSPVKSPSPSPHRGNLQGSARKLKDAAADWHNYILKWNNLSADGMTIVNKIANIKLEKLFSVENGSEATTLDLMSPELEPLCDALTITVQAMEKVVKKMESLNQLLSGVILLETSQLSQTNDNPVLFHTWGLAEFEESFQELHKMYSEEWKLKSTIAQNVAHARDRNLLMVYTSSWLHQPYINDRAEVLLESLLLETGHKEIT